MTAYLSSTESKSRESVATRLLARSFLILLVTMSCFACDKARGIAEVKELCAKDGGERIIDTAFVDGYRTENERYFCVACIEHLGRRDFSYVDSFVDAGFPGDAPAYYRYSITGKDDPRCESWVRTDVPNPTGRLAELGIKDTECIVVTRLDRQPDEYRVQYRRHQFDTARGSTIRVDEWVLDRVPDQLVLATVRNYYFASKLAALLDMSGGGGTP